MGIFILSNWFVATKSGYIMFVCARCMCCVYIICGSTDWIIKCYKITGIINEYIRFIAACVCVCASVHSCDGFCSLFFVSFHMKSVWNWLIFITVTMCTHSTTMRTLRCACVRVCMDEYSIISREKLKLRTKSMSMEIKWKMDFESRRTRTHRIDNNNIDQICIDWYNQLSEFYYYPWSSNVWSTPWCARIFFQTQIQISIARSLSPCMCTHLFVMRRFRFASMNNRFSMSLFPLIIHAIYIHVSYTPSVRLRI